MDINNNSEVEVALTHPEIGVITSGKGVYKHRKQLAQAPANIKISAAFMLLRDTDWTCLLTQFVSEVVADDDRAKATKKLDRIMNFTLEALHSSVKEEAISKANNRYRNN